MDDLFKHTAFAELKAAGLKVTKKERIVYDKFVTINGITFDADDLLCTLDEVSGGNVSTDFGDKETKLLKELGILESEGSQRNCYPARLGNNAKEFIEMLEKEMFHGK